MSRKKEKLLPSMEQRIKAAREFPLGQPDFATDVAITCGNYILADPTQMVDYQYERAAWKERLYRLLRAAPASEQGDA